jgi:hypothetical protein
MRDPVFQGCALRWENGWAFGPKNLSQPDSPFTAIMSAEDLLRWPRMANRRMEDKIGNWR